MDDMSQVHSTVEDEAIVTPPQKDSKQQATPRSAILTSKRTPKMSGGVSPRFSFGEIGPSSRTSLISESSPPPGTKRYTVTVYAGARGAMVRANPEKESEEIGVARMGKVVHGVEERIVEGGCWICLSASSKIECCDEVTHKYINASASCHTAELYGSMLYIISIEEYLSLESRTAL